MRPQRYYTTDPPAVQLCIKCKAPLPEGAAFCPACGKKQAEQKKKKRHAKRPSGVGSIVKLPGNRKSPYMARMPEKEINGKTVRPILGCYATYTEADQALREAQGSQIPVKKYTLETIWDVFQSSNYFQALSDSGQESHRKAWKYLDRYKGIKAADLSTEPFQQAVDAMKEKGLSRETMAKVRNLASLLCKECMRLRLIEVNFGQLVQLPKQDKDTSVRSFTLAELDILWQAAEDGSQDAMVVLLMCYTGMRPGELLGVDIAQHIRKRREWTYIQTGSKTEAGRNRIIPVPDIILPFLEQLQGNREEGPLVQTATGQYWRVENWRKRRFYPLMEKLGIESVVPYTCRHTFADLQKRRGVDGEIMMEIMGHTDYSTTVERYHTTSDDDIERICQAVHGMSRPIRMTS